MSFSAWGVKQSADANLARQLTDQLKSAARGAANLGKAVANLIRSEEANSDDGKAQDQERDSKRFYDKDARKRAQDRSRGADGDPTCEYCGVKTTDEPGKKNSSTVDHVKAWSKGGKTTDDNSANACLSCNSSKGNRDLGTEWIPPNER